MRMKHCKLVLWAAAMVVMAWLAYGWHLLATLAERFGMALRRAAHKAERNYHLANVELLLARRDRLRGQEPTSTGPRRRY